MGFHRSVSPRGFDCGFNPDNNIKKEEEAGPLPLSLTVSDYLTPSWSLSPSSSPLSHSEASDSDREEDEEEEEDDDDDDEEELEDLRGRMMQRRKKRKTAPASKKKAQRVQPRPLSFARSAPSSSPFQTPLAPPTTNINNNININIGRGTGGTVSRRQHCPYCGRNFRSLARHLEKHHDQQPEIRAAMELAHLRSSQTSTATHPAGSGSHSFTSPLQPSTSSSAAPGPSLFSRERDSQSASNSGAVSFSLSLSPTSTTNNTSSPRSHMPPLLSSLSTLVLYLRRQQHSSFLSLSRAGSSAEAWRLLCHSSLALLILYNRHRECEVAKLTVQDYRSRVTPSPSSSSSGSGNSSNSSHSPLEGTLSPFERQVLCHRPRVGVLGKRGRVQPLILPPHSEACLDLLLKTSADVGVDPQSPYVFSRPFHSPATPLRGTDLLRGLARSSGAKNPTALTAPRARRQVAILTQLLMLEEGEKPQGVAAKRLEEFLQKEYHVTQSCTRIGQDPALMGRVSRVVLYGERDGVLFRGMSLQHICLELDMSGNSGDSFSEESEVEGEKSKEKVDGGKKAGVNGRGPRPKKSFNPHVLPTTPSPSAGHKRRAAQIKSKRGVLKRPWSEAERVAVETHLKRNILELRVPAKADCERCLQHCPLLVTNQRDWR
uniref:Si:cabz01080528.1 n=1 Tax=Astyanax mexicanus TaxID=7994 RepID=A0A3B1J558_ASTMX